MVDLACPVPTCDYGPPSNLKPENQQKALQRHISLAHSISDFPAVVQAMKEAETPQPEEPPTEAEKPTEPQEGPQEKRETVGVQQRAARTQDKGSAPLRSLPAIAAVDPKKQRIDERAERWGKYLFTDFNPLLVTATQQFAGIPEAWMNGGPNPDGSPVTIPTPDGKVLTFWNPPLREQLRLSAKDCERIAKAGAVFAESPMGMAVDAWLQHNAHFIALGSALWVAGAYGWKVMRIRTEVTQLKEVIAQQMSMAQPGPASNPSDGEAA